ncbi:hypothetical protein PG991_015221 [Apiospora marii]|uniref:Transmembrane protein n=1 Tax=Apiospora marii TaxID=335849 RepID=A0ABR1R111_9PEZI
MDANDSIYLGLWTNWSRGYVLGSTWTLSRKHGNYVIALTAFFIAFVATRFWRISCFVFHQCLSNPARAETMHRQRQIILCNSSSPEAGLLSLSTLLWVSRRLGPRRLHGLVLLILFVIVSISCFVVAGSASSRISTDVGSEVLLRADDCGQFVGRPTSGWSNKWNLNVAEKISTAIQYAEQCYASDRTSKMVRCAGFIVPKLPTAVMNYHAGCPFQDSLCRSNSSNILLDTGYLDSREHFGLNTPDSQRFQQREVLHCAPLKTEGYESTVSTGNQRFVAYDYGGVLVGTRDNLTEHNFTYRVEDLDFQYRKGGTGRPVVDFRVASEYSYTVQNKPAQSKNGGRMVPGHRALDQGPDKYLAGPHQPVQVRDGGVPHGLREAVAMVQPVAAERPGLRAAGQLLRLLCRGGAPVRHHRGGAGPRSAVDPGPPGSAAIWANMILSSNPQQLNDFIIYARSGALASKGLVFSAVALGLPDDQWKRDVVKWWSMIMATWQMAYINAVRGPNMPEFEELRTYPVNDTEKTFCENQKILSTAHTSFSMFGLCFTLATGALIIMISYILDPLFECLHTRYRHKSYQHLEWRSNATLQIHRLGEEQVGFSTWENCTALVPTTTGGADDAVMSRLDITDPTHPRLRRPASKTAGLPLDDLCEGDGEEQHKGEERYYASNKTEIGSVASPVSTADTVVVDPRYGSYAQHRGGHEPSPVSASACEVSPLESHQTPSDLAYMTRIDSHQPQESGGVSQGAVRST